VDSLSESETVSVDLWDATVAYCAVIPAQELGSHAQEGSSANANCRKLYANLRRRRRGMPYVHTRDVKKLGRAVKAMRADEDMSAQDVCQLVEKAQRKDEKKFSISQDSVRRLTLGKSIGMSEALRVLYRAMMSSDDYRGYLIDAGFENEQALYDFPAALAAFFQPEAESQPGILKFSLEDVKRCLPGQYIMYRRDFEGLMVAQQGVRVSRVSIETQNGHLCISETQDFVHPLDGIPFHQHDEGHVFCYGPHVHFLMKEPRGGCVKLGAASGADNNFSFDERRPPAPGNTVQIFFGALYVMSWLSTYHRTLFFCRRCTPETLKEKGGIVPLAKINDTRAVEFIRPDFTPG
jgi:hypothetical protein